MALVSVAERFFAQEPAARRALSRSYCQALEKGDILFFPRSPLIIPAEDVEFLLRQRQAAGAHHKNIAYKPASDRLTGYGSGDAERMRGILRRFSAAAIGCLAELLSPYCFAPDFASFRPIEEQGRQLKPRARNDLLHVDSFPTRPTGGRRILRFFVNLNPLRPRVWKTGPPFPELARRYAVRSGLLVRARSLTWEDRLARAGLPLRPRPAYDRFMLLFHHWLKANAELQRSPEHSVWEFPPHSAWLCLTDTVSHAVLSGQYAIEQTMLVERDGLQLPELAPRAIFERMAATPPGGARAA